MRYKVVNNACEPGQHVAVMLQDADLVRLLLNSKYVLIFQNYRQTWISSGFPRFCASVDPGLDFTVQPSANGCLTIAWPGRTLGQRTGRARLRCTPALCRATPSSPTCFSRSPPCPSLLSESPVRIACPSHLSESPVRVGYPVAVHGVCPSRLSESPARRAGSYIKRCDGHGQRAC